MSKGHQLVTKALKAICFILLLSGSGIALAVDTDGDGCEDNADAFPNDTSEWADNDSDGLGSNLESQIGTSDGMADTDGDSLGDYIEYINATTDPRLSDTDKDGLWDDEEATHGTDPLDDDSDDDGVLDGSEIAAGSDPLDGNEARGYTGFHQAATSIPTLMAIPPDIGTLGFSWTIRGELLFTWQYGDAHGEWFSGNYTSVYASNAYARGAVSGDGQRKAYYDGTSGGFASDHTATVPEDRRIYEGSWGNIADGYGLIHLDHDGDTVAFRVTTHPAGTVVKRWTGFQWIYKGINLNSVVPLALSDDGNTLIGRLDNTLKIYNWTGLSWQESGISITTNQCQFSGSFQHLGWGSPPVISKNLEFAVAQSHQCDRPNPYMSMAGKIIVYQRTLAGWQQVGNEILSDEANTRLKALAISDDGTRLLATREEGEQWLSE